MEFELRARSADFLSPTYSFPGDELIDRETYAACIMSGYISSVSTISGVAQGFGLDLDAETFERSKRVASAAGLLDDLLDESPEPDVAYELYQTILCDVFTGIGANICMPEWVDERLEPVVRLLSNSVQELPSWQVDCLVGAAQRIGELVLIKRKCHDINEYVNLLGQEALHTSTLMYGIVSPAVMAQPGFTKFARFCQRAMELGTFDDHRRDLWGDRRRGRTAVGATVLNSMRIGAQMRRPIRTITHFPENMHAARLGLLRRSTFYL